MLKTIAIERRREYFYRGNLAIRRCKESTNDSLRINTLENCTLRKNIKMKLFSLIATTLTTGSTILSVHSFIVSVQYKLTLTKPVSYRVRNRKRLLAAALRLQRLKRNNK